MAQAQLHEFLLIFKPHPSQAVVSCPQQPPWALLKQHPPGYPLFLQSWFILPVVLYIFGGRGVSRSPLRIWWKRQMDCLLRSILTGFWGLWQKTLRYQWFRWDRNLCFMWKTSLGRQHSIGVTPLHSRAMAPFILLLCWSMASTPWSKMNAHAPAFTSSSQLHKGGKHEEGHTLCFLGGVYWPFVTYWPCVTSFFHLA